MSWMVVYGLTFISLIITMVAQAFVSSSYSKYSKIKNERGVTGAEAARYILDKNGLNNVYVVETGGYLTDHYDPTRKVIKLSSNVYKDASIGAVAVACHECGHAIQDKENYTFMRIRSKLVPIVNFSSYAGYFAIILGMLFSSQNLIWLGILMEVIILLFQLITLPVEIDASKRALRELDYSHILNSKELKQGKTMLTAAALTYVASIATTIIQILRLILIFGRRDD
mgnify:FL=1